MECYQKKLFEQPNTYDTLNINFRYKTLSKSVYLFISDIIKYIYFICTITKKQPTRLAKYKYSAVTELPSLMISVSLRFSLRSTLQLRVVQNAAHPLFHCDFPRLPHEFAYGYNTGNTHSTHQYHKNTTNVCQAQLVGGAAGLGCFILKIKGVNKDNCENEFNPIFTLQAPPPRFSFHHLVFSM